MNRLGEFVNQEEELPAVQLSVEKSEEFQAQKNDTIPEEMLNAKESVEEKGIRV